MYPETCWCSWVTGRSDWTRLVTSETGSVVFGVWLVFVGPPDRLRNSVREPRLTVFVPTSSGRLGQRSSGGIRFDPLVLRSGPGSLFLVVGRVLRSRRLALVWSAWLCGHPTNKTRSAVSSKAVTTFSTVRTGERKNPGCVVALDFPIGRGAHVDPPAWLPSNQKAPPVFEWVRTPTGLPEGTGLACGARHRTKASHATR